MRWAARLGARVEVFMSDDLEAFGKVFGEFMQTEEFYLLTPERQDYLRDVLLSIEAAGQPDEVYRTLLGANKVFPRSQPPTLDPQTMAANMAANMSANTLLTHYQRVGQHTTNMLANTLLTHQLTHYRRVGRIECIRPAM